MSLNIKLLNNLLANIKVNYIAKNKYSKIKYNKNLLYLLHFLKKEGYIISYKLNKKVKNIYIYLKYFKSKPLFTQIKFYSKPSSIYLVNNKSLKKIAKRNSFIIISTKKGLMFAKEASKRGYGGILLFEINN